MPLAASLPRPLRAGLLALSLTLGLCPASAQTLVATVNGDPITTADLEERMRLLRALRRPATRETALESMIADSLRFKEIRKFGIRPGEDDMTNEMIRAARAAKVEPQQFANGLQRAGVSSAHMRNHWQAEAGFSFYVRARNRTLEPSDAEVRAEAAAQGKPLTSTDYRLQEVVFIVPRDGSGALLNQRGQQALQLRSRFTDCESGVELARAMPEVAVKSAVTRNSATMAPALAKILDDTPLGHLTAPQRQIDGLGMVAVCERKVSQDIANVRTAVSAEILSRKLEGEAQRLYGELRSRAVIIKQ